MEWTEWRHQGQETRVEPRGPRLSFPWVTKPRISAKFSEFLGCTVVTCRTFVPGRCSGPYSHGDGMNEAHSLRSCGQRIHPCPRADSAPSGKLGRITSRRSTQPVASCRNCERALPATCPIETVPDWGVRPVAQAAGTIGVPATVSETGRGAGAPRGRGLSSRGNRLP